MFMSSDPAITEPPHADFYRGILHGLIQGGANYADMLHLQAKARFEAAPATAEITKGAIAYDNVSRSVRRGILMAQRVDKPVRSRASHHQSARRQIIRAVEDCIQRHADDEEADEFQLELLDRLDSPDLEDDIDSRPVADIIKEICRDLGLDIIEGAHPWKRRTPADLAELSATANIQVPSGRPFSGRVKGRREPRFQRTHLDPSEGERRESRLPAPVDAQASEPSAAIPRVAAATTSRLPGLPRQTDPPFAHRSG